jgi:putative membrane protein
MTNHPYLYLIANIRHSINHALKITAETPTSLSIAYASEMRLMEKHLNNLILLMGGLERVRATPLPIVFVTHLRTFLMVYLLSMPYLYGHLWGWGTIPAASITAYILLGIDGSASECVSPFKKRANHLAMEAYCVNALNNIEDLYIENAQRRMKNL